MSDVKAIYTMGQSRGISHSSVRINSLLFSAFFESSEFLKVTKNNLLRDALLIEPSFDPIDALDQIFKAGAFSVFEVKVASREISYMHLRLCKTRCLWQEDKE
jgi:hypothetical protein